MGFEPKLDPLEWNLKKQAETEERLRKEAEKNAPAGGAPPAVESRLAPETTPELASRTWHNIIVEIPGTELPKEVLIVSAHFDAVPGSPGADDDGSGVAVLLEAARVLKDRPMKRTVRLIFFNLEELPLLGSKSYVQRLKARLEAGEETIVGMVSLEMLGYFSDAPNSQRSPIPRIEGFFEPPTVGDFLGVLTSKNHSAFARRWAEGMVNAAPALKVNVADMFPIVPPDFLRSDHGPFLLSGMPALMLTDTSNFRNPNYHQPTDTIPTLDPERLTLAAKGVVGGIRAVADGPALQESKQPAGEREHKD
jgi:Zn-dependent M28 family amino/carboxypeptidase